jgi:glycosyltransferase involved in cell wall biosynthesis
LAKIGVITYDFFPFIGGIGRVTYTLYCELKNKNILFFSPANNLLSGHIRVKFWAVRFFKQVGVSIWLFFHASRIISEYRLDKLNIHSGPGGVLLTRRLPIPVIVTCHHTHWQQYHHIRSLFWNRLFLPFEKRTYRLAASIVCVSEDTKRILVEHYGISPEKITVIHNAVDTGKFYPLNVPKHRNTLLYVGRVDKRKGIEFLIRSMTFVREQVPDALLLVGGTGGYLGKMKSLVSRLRLDRNVTFLGFVPDDQLNLLYNQAQCVVVPSIFEGFGITVIEALAAGTRVVGTNVDGIRSILTSGDYGSLVPYGDHHALAGAIVSELRNPKSAQGLRPEYQVDQFRDRYLKVLEEA